MHSLSPFLKYFIGSNVQAYGWAREMSVRVKRFVRFFKYIYQSS